MTQISVSEQNGHKATRNVRSLAEAGVAVMAAAEPMEKVRLTRAYDALRKAGELPEIGTADPPDRPARPPTPDLLLPREMPKRRKAGSTAGRIALLHALAHIELNAIDLSWDVIARFAGPGPERSLLTDAFFDGWLKVAFEEAKHFALLSERLEALGSHYGALPAHDGLWQASADTAHDLAARLAIVPMVLEARGLDVTPAMIANLRKAGDDASADILQIIHDDEIGHVAIGKRWFEVVCKARGVEPIETWQGLVRRYFNGVLKRPFNTKSRDLADFAAAFYEPLGV